MMTNVFLIQNIQLRDVGLRYVFNLLLFYKIIFIVRTLRLAENPPLTLYLLTGLMGSLDRSINKSIRTRLVSLPYDSYL